MRRALGVLALVLAGTGCSARELAAWVDWHANDPESAIEFAQRPEVVADLATGEHEQSAPSVRGGTGGADGVGIPGDCSSYADDIAAAGLPAVFVRIAWRESGCDHTRFTNDHDDLGGYLTGLNFRTANLRNGWLSWCGATLGNIRYDVTRQIRCTAEAYRRLGMRPWS